jgi:asparagine synthetase B (glutamine-hydrolysing)
MVEAVVLLSGGLDSTTLLAQVVRQCEDAGRKWEGWGTCFTSVQGAA